MAELQDKIHVITKIAALFQSCSLAWAVGASMMLYLRGVVDTFQDIDLLVAEEDIHKAVSQMERIGILQPSKSNPQYQTKHFYEFAVDGVEVDLMAGFVIVKDGIAYPCPLTTDTIDTYLPLGEAIIPLQSLETWYRYYTWMGRTAKADCIRMALGLNRERTSHISMDRNL